MPHMQISSCRDRRQLSVYMPLMNSLHSKCDQKHQYIYILHY